MSVVIPLAHNGANYHANDEDHHEQNLRPMNFTGYSDVIVTSTKATNQRNSISLVPSLDLDKVANTKTINLKEASNASSILIN